MLRCVIIAADRPAAWFTSARIGKLPQNASNRAAITEPMPEAELGRVLQEDSPGTLHKFGNKRYWHGYFLQISIEFKEGKIGAFLHNVSHGPIPQAVCVKFHYNMNGSTPRPWNLCRETGSRTGKENLFPILSPITDTFGKFLLSSRKVKSGPFCTMLRMALSLKRCASSFVII